MRKRE
jgi:hypothetical protein